MNTTSSLRNRAENMFPFSGKPRETRFHSLENPGKHVSILWKTALLLLACLLLALPVAAGDVATVGAEPGQWTHDYAAATELARAKNLPVLMNFTGSDWCIWCKRMDDRVFSTDRWRDFSANLVLITIDFPSDESKLPSGAAARNRQLQQIFRVRGYPTFVLLSPTGEKLLTTGTDLDPDSFIATLRDALPAAAPQPVVESEPKPVPAAEPATDPEPEPDTPSLAEAIAATEAAPAPAPAAAAADPDPFDLPDDLVAAAPEPPHAAAAIVDIRGLASFLRKVCPPDTLDAIQTDYATSPNTLPQALLAAAFPHDPDARLVVLHDPGPSAYAAAALRLAFHDDDAPDAFLAALVDAGFKTLPPPADAADLPTLVTLESPGPIPDTTLYLLRLDNALYLDNDLACLRRGLEFAPTLPTILPAEGDAVVQLLPPAVHLFLANTPAGALLPPSICDALARQFAAYTVGLHLEGDLLRLQAHLEPVPAGRLQAYLASSRPASAEAPCVLLPDALATLVDGASDPVLEAALGAAVTNLLASVPAFADSLATSDAASPLPALEEAMRGQSSSFALFPPASAAADDSRVAPPFRLPSFLAYNGLNPDAPDAYPELLAFLDAHPRIFHPAPDDPLAAHRNLAISTYVLDLPALLETLFSIAPGPRTLRDVATSPRDLVYSLAAPITIRLARLPAGFLVGSVDPDRFTAALDAALDATAPRPDQTPAFLAAFPYPDAPAIATFHCDFTALLASCMPQAARRLADAVQEYDRLATGQDGEPFATPPCIAPDAGPADAPAVIDVFAYLTPQNTLVLREALHLRPFLVLLSLPSFSTDYEPEDRQENTPSSSPSPVD